jgi:hypothetical protein
MRHDSQHPLQHSSQQRLPTQPHLPIARWLWLGWGSLLVACLLWGTFVSFAQTTATGNSTSTEMTQTTPDNMGASLQFDSLTQQLEHGAQTYDLHCATCHGDTGLGFAEAKLAFPEDHRRCHYCHRRHNPPQMPLAVMTSRNAFDIGEAPALVGDGTLEHFANATALYYYSQATMPRPFPGDLDDATYLAIIVHMLRLRNALPTALTAANQPIQLEQLTGLIP